MAENNAEVSTQPSLLRRIFGKKAKEQPTAITSPTPQEPEGVTPETKPAWVEKATKGELPAKDYTVRVDPSNPNEVLGKL